MPGTAVVARLQHDEQDNREREHREEGESEPGMSASATCCIQMVARVGVKTYGAPDVEYMRTEQRTWWGDPLAGKRWPSDRRPAPT